MDSTSPGPEPSSPRPAPLPGPPPDPGAASLAQSAPAPALTAPPQEKLLLAVLALVQFSHIMDFMIIMPLGPQFMRVFDVNPQQFGLVVSSYTFAAAVFGFIGAFFLDRLDRKTALLSLYAGFVVGTLLCALAPSYLLLVLARVVAGAFGGLVSATIYAILGDAIPAVRRGAATGIVMSSFSLASVAGVPFGLVLATRFDWHAPFYFIVFLGAVLLVLARFGLPRMRAHLDAPRTRSPVAEVKAVLAQQAHRRAFMLIFVLMFAGFSVIPFLSPYLVANAGVAEKDLHYIYLCGGAATFFTGPLIGRLCDRHGTFKVLRATALASVLPILAITNMPPAPLPVVLLGTTLFMVFVSGRIVPTMALINARVMPQLRGSFMSINSSVQMMGSGLASYGAGLLVGKDARTGALTHYGVVGAIAVFATFAALFLAARLDRVEPAGTTPSAGSGETPS